MNAEDNIEAKLEILGAGLTLQHQQWDGLDSKAGIALGTAAGLVVLLMGWATTRPDVSPLQGTGVASVVLVFFVLTGFAWEAMRPRTVWGIPMVEDLDGRPPTEWADALAGSIKDNRPLLDAKATAVWRSLKLLALQIVLALAVTSLSV